MTVSRIPVWLDCDPGHDDTVAILLALHHPLIDLVGISTTYGNAPLENTTRNARSMMTAFGGTVPIYAGSSRPLKKAPHYAPGIHGDNGLGGIKLPEPKVSLSNDFGDEDAMIDAIYATTKKYQSTLALVAVGPLTNVARLFQKYPDSKTNIKVLSIMGGGIHIGNIGDGAEFNIFDDPAAAGYVFTDPVLAPKTILVPLDVTHTVLCTNDVQKRIMNGAGSELRRMIHDLMTFFAETYKKEQEGFSPGPPVHDPVAVYVLLEEYGMVDVGMKFEKYAMTVVQDGEQEGKILWKEDETNGSKVVFGINVKKFWDDLLVCLEKADTQ